MAHVETSDNPNLPIFYNVDQAVGGKIIPMGEGIGTYEQLQPNRRDDVMLVQYLLKRIYENPNNFQPPLRRPADKKNMKVDGLYGPQTRKWIHHFQVDSRKRGNNIATDGVVDRARGAVASISKTFYTIRLMNLGFRKARPDLFFNLAQDPECPPELALAVGLVITPAA